VDRLVYIESFRDLRTAIAREKQIKSWRREKKLALIAHMNPTWLDFGAEWKLGRAKKMQIPRFARDDKGKMVQH
jgi:putative endonuclease